MVTPENIQDWIKAGLTDADVSVEGDGHHFEAIIVCDDFAGKNSVQRHQMVYQVLGDKMKAEIHALSMKTMTQEEQQAS